MFDEQTPDRANTSYTCNIQYYNCNVVLHNVDYYREKQLYWGAAVSLHFQTVILNIFRAVVV